MVTRNQSGRGKKKEEGIALLVTALLLLLLSYWLLLSGREMVGVRERGC